MDLDLIRSEVVRVDQVLLFLTAVFHASLVAHQVQPRSTAGQAYEGVIQNLGRCRRCIGFGHQHFHSQ
ncbi:hypothetical protein D3C78_1777070 [compost metagenome]